MEAGIIFILFVCAVSSLDGAATCDRKWKKVGCYQDYIKPERPLRQELVNRRDRTNPNFDGHMIDWFKYPETIHALYCKCAELTEAKGYSHFGLQFYGECWSGPSAESRFSMYGESSRCIGTDFKPCVDSAETECIGKDATNYIYKLSDNKTKGIVDGGYSEWSNWTPCSRSCGGGFRLRQRTCTNPAPANGGKDCSRFGAAEQVDNCGNQPCKKACSKTIELGIIMDASSSVRKVNYNKMKDFIKLLSDDFDISPSGTHFGIIHYSYSARLDFTPSDSRYHDRTALKGKVDSIIYSYGSTRTDKALRLAEKKFFCSSCVRPGKPKVLLVITDGNTNPGSEDLGVATKNMKDNGVTILSLGVGPSISSSELHLIASEPTNKHVFQIDTFDKLKVKLAAIMEGACEATR